MENNNDNNDNNERYANYDFVCPHCGSRLLYVRHDDGKLYEVVDRLVRKLSRDGGTALEYYMPSIALSALGIPRDVKALTDKKYICGKCGNGWDYIDNILDNWGLRLRIKDDRMLALAVEANNAAAKVEEEAEKKNDEVLEKDIKAWTPLNRVMVRFTAYSSRLAAEGFTTPDIIKASEMLMKHMNG